MRVVVLALIASSVAACANDVTSPQLQPTPENSISAAITPTGPWVFGRRGMGVGPMILFASRRLPDNLKLTDGQRAQVKSLITAFRAAHKDDLDAMRASAKRAFAARKAGERLTPDQRRSMFAQTAPARQRLMSASATLRTQIEQVLTSDQKAWLASHRPTRSNHHRAA